MKASRTPPLAPSRLFSRRFQGGRRYFSGHAAGVPIAGVSLLLVFHVVVHVVGGMTPGVRLAAPLELPSAPFEDGVPFGALVVAVTEDEPGAQNGIKVDDVIVKINLVEVKNTDDFERAVKGLKSGYYVRVSIKRGSASIIRVFKLP